ncbi:helix-turn-helix domain-containing protein [Desertihabitans aurantiacus]|uniref:helix-turn-helix domain-containing protein n=1 Tax=Desertihabitans aurantiacus TaxID=2282477 RepID=UPI000DF7696F|nr:MerR family transcriptional regulator [Desertihabitans aurantiacus]
MAWSTRELAELAGTTVKAVRHYHEVGLLEEPERASNGYKQYRIQHLVRLLRIKRLAELGLPLSQIADLGDAEQRPQEALQVLDAELAATVERLQRVRAELQVILRHGTPVDLPEGFGTVGAHLTDADRALVLIYSRVFDDAGMDTVREMLRTADRTPEDEEFEALPADADEETRRDLAERYTPQIQRLLRDNPAVAALGAQLVGGPGSAGRTLGRALNELYNPAQVDVFRRVNALLSEDGAAARQDG